MIDHSLFAVVLAAGESRRFGRTKQLAEFGGRPLVTGAARLAESVCGERSVLVTGKDWQAVHGACAPLAGFMVYNERFADGIGPSLAAGVRAVRQQAGAVLVLLADQPLVGPADLRDLLAAWERGGRRYACSRYGGNLGPPAVFPADAFPELVALVGDRGARRVLDAHADELTVLECAAGSADVDTPGDLDALARTPRR